MTDELEQRLRAIGEQPVPPISQRRIHAIEERVMAHRRPPATRWLAAAAAIVVIAVAAVAFGLQRDRTDTLQPVAPPTEPPITDASASTTVTTSPDETTTLAPTTTTPTTIAPVVPPSIGQGGTTVPVPAGTTPPAPTTSPSTVAPTTTVAPSTTVPAPQPVPAPSFTLTVQRVGDKLVFIWPTYTGADGRRYVLVRATPAGLNQWPVAPSRIARTIVDMGATRTIIDMPATDQKAWVLVVLGENRQLLAVSTVAISN